MILLVYKEAYFNINYLDHYILIICVSLLQDFKDIFPDKIPSGLPPIRGIEHQIDLVPRASVPNQLAYRINHDEIKKTINQVEESLPKNR